MDKPLVSIITPCYNGAKVMHRLLNSILEQTYKNIEFILVNDGSTDNSENIWKQYEKKFRESGIKTIYIYQKNAGLGAAINTGLAAFSGEYLCWPDVDDFLEKTSVEKRVRFLEEHKDYGSVSSDANKYLENNLEKPVGTMANYMQHIGEEWQFKWLLLGQSLFCSGCHMLRTSCFLDVNPNRYIYPARRGQNNQMLLPIYYKYKHGYINEPLYNYIVYNHSMSTPDTTEEMALNRINEYIALLKWTFEQINMKEQDITFCDNKLRQIEWYEKSEIYFKFSKPLDALRIYFKLRMYKTESKKEIKRVLLEICKKRKMYE